MSDSNCNGCRMSLSKFLKMTDETELSDELLTFLINHGVILASLKCLNCNELCKLSKDQFWRCRLTRTIHKGKKKIKDKCEFKQSLRKNTFFDKSHLSIQKICEFVAYHFVMNPPRTLFLRNELDISPCTANDWASFMREVAIDWCSVNSLSRIGGVGKIVEIDEAKMGKRKYHRGRIIEGQWVFGGFERGSKKLFIVAVENRTQATLLEVIKDKIEVGTTIISDCWKAYDCLNNEGFKHLSVNHTYNFVDPDTGAHTQNIERIWREVRAKVPRYGRIDGHFAGYLAEFFFKRQFPNYKDRLHEIFLAIGQLYNPSANDMENLEAAENLNEEHDEEDECKLWILKLKLYH